MKKVIIIFLLSSVALFSQSAGKNGMSFLKFGFGARNIAMGDAASALSTDVTTLFYNPAGLAENDNAEIILMHNEWIQDVKSEVLGAKFTLFGLNLAAGFNVTSVDGIEVRQYAGLPQTTFNAEYYFGSLSTGFYITDEISFGATAKYLYEGYLHDESNGLAFDFGLRYLTPLKGLTASAVFKNIGSMDNLRNEPTELPSELRVGAMYDFGMVASKINVLAAAEFQNYTKASETHINAGAEAMYDNTIALRVGYQSGYDTRGFTGGLGLTWGRLKFDYAFVPFSLGFGSSSLFSLQFRF